ncbi:MAG: pilus assembly protein [Anaerolineae bacterium]|nr:pilus assembly protein [Anaerolineae bacterium]
MLFLPQEEGQGLVEYALILVLIAVVVIAILLVLGPVVGNVFSNIVYVMQNPRGAGGVW